MLSLLAKHVHGIELVSEWSGPRLTGADQRIIHLNPPCLFILSRQRCGPAKAARIINEFGPKTPWKRQSNAQNAVSRQPMQPTDVASAILEPKDPTSQYKLRNYSHHRSFLYVLRPIAPLDSHPNVQAGNAPLLLAHQALNPLVVRAAADAGCHCVLVPYSVYRVLDELSRSVVRSLDEDARCLEDRISERCRAIQSQLCCVRRQGRLEP